VATQVDRQPGAAAAVIEVDERNFKEAVLERSRTVPVVVDFWAPWCGPCRALGPLLERLAAEAQDAFVLAKINVDHSPRLAQMFHVQGIPAVKAFRDGRVVDEFTGALPETQVRAWLQRFVPARADRAAEELEALEALEASAPSEAAARYRAMLEDDPQNAAALFGLGRLLVRQDDPEGVEILRQVQAGTPFYARALAWAQLAGFFAQAAEGNSLALAEQVARQPSDLEARYRLAAALAHNRDYEGAIVNLLAIVERDRAFRDDGARKMLLALFETLGADQPLVVQGRRKLANLLF
jgi:putative thioredoxin